MTDLWGFLLQTLTASGVAALLLVVKAMFRDKLSPRWQFAVWGILGAVMLVPAGFGGRYVLVNWPWLVEAAKSILTGDYSLTRVTAPIPLPPSGAPASVAEWLYVIYAAGVLVFLLRYIASYVRLRLALCHGTPAAKEQADQIAAAAKQYGLSPCRAVQVPGLTSAFICGIFRPVLALPAGAETDSKVLLHELLHLKYRDAAWGLLICFFRCLHWCNPLLWYCANRAGNDLEACCDQRVLELLTGEDRRDYGRILLSMADERFARTPGTSSIANGGKNIRRRIEAITRFKRYPAGMGLASACVALILAAPLLLGSTAQTPRPIGGSMYGAWDVPIAMASARTLACTTPAGAVDTYAKSVLDQNGYYRAICAPLAEQEHIADSMLSAAQGGEWPLWDPGLPAWPNAQSGYYLYNFAPIDGDAYEGLLVVELNYPPDGQPGETDMRYLGVQTLRVEQEGHRWVVIPQEEFRSAAAEDMADLAWGCSDLPSLRYEAQAEDFTVRLEYQVICTVDSYVQSDGLAFPSYDTTPQLQAEFSACSNAQLYAIYTGDTADKDSVSEVAASCAPMRADGKRPQLYVPDPSEAGTGISSYGILWGFKALEPGWEPQIQLAGGGIGGSSGSEADAAPPDAYAADLYLNGQKTAELTLLPVEGGTGS